MSASKDFRTRLGSLRRRAKVLVAAGLVGLAAGSAYAVLSPTPLTSTALVLLPTPALAESASSDVTTQVRIAESVDVLDRAGQALVPALPAREVAKLVKIDATTDQLLEITVTSADPAVARQLTQSTAEAYVNYVRNAGQEVTSAALADLNNRRNDLQGQYDQLQKEIAASARRLQVEVAESPTAVAEAQLLGGLRQQQADIALQLDKVKDKIASGTPAGTSATGTLVVQQASLPAGPSLLKRLAVWGPATGLGAALLAAVIVLVASRNDARVRTRDEVADAIGSPVLASMRSRPQRSMSGWSALMTSYTGPPTESWALRQVLRGLGPGAGPRLAGRLDHPATITVVSLAGDERALAIGPQLAGFTASLGVETRLVPVSGEEAAPALWATATEQAGVATAHLSVGPQQAGSTAELTVYLVVLDRRSPDLGTPPASAATVLAVSSGNATEQELARAAVAIDNAGRPIDGIVLADPEQNDKTSGRHSVAERSTWPALPTRLTGLAANGDDLAGGRS